MAATANVFALLGDGDSDDIQQLAAKAAVAAPAPVKAAAEVKKPAPKADAGETSLTAGGVAHRYCITN